MEIQPSLRYTLFGLAGMSEGRCPLFLHSVHSFQLLSFSFRTYALATAKGSMSYCFPLPSQSGMEIQPSSRYVLSGEAGMLEGRCPLLLHSLHSITLFSFSFRTYARPAAKGSMFTCRAWLDVLPLPSQSGHEIQPSSRYTLDGREGISEGRWPLLLHSLHPFQVFSPSPRTSARPSVKLFHATRGIESIDVKKTRAEEVEERLGGTRTLSSRRIQTLSYRSLVWSPEAQVRSFCKSFTKLGFEY